MPKAKNSPVDTHSLLDANVNNALTNSSVIATSSRATSKAVQIKAEPEILPEHRCHLIATAAYFLAEKRGFVGGYEMHDWLTSEREIDSQLKS